MADRPDGNLPRFARWSALLAQNQAGMWAWAAGGCLMALLLSYLSTRQQDSGDLRLPVILLADALVGAAAGLVWASGRGIPARVAAGRCVAYGLWAAAAFRLVPPIINESVLFFSDSLSADVPWVVVGAVAHGGLAALLAVPHAIHISSLGKKSLFGPGTDEFRLTCGTMIAFLVIASVVRVLAELRS